MRPLFDWLLTYLVSDLPHPNPVALSAFHASTALVVRGRRAVGKKAHPRCISCPHPVVVDVGSFHADRIHLRDTVSRH